MRTHRLSLVAVAFLGCWLSSGTPAQAELIRWHYDFAVTSRQLPPGGSHDMVSFGIMWASRASMNSMAGLKFEPFGGGELTGDSASVEIPVRSFWSQYMKREPEFEFSEPYNHYRLGFGILDRGSRLYDNFWFEGVIQGSISATDAQISNTFVGGNTKTFLLGRTQYDLTADFEPPGPPGGPPGSVTVHVHATRFPLRDTPEPSTLLLAAIGSVGGFAGAWWNRRSNRGRLAPSPRLRG